MTCSHVFRKMPRNDALSMFSLMKWQHFVLEGCLYFRKKSCVKQLHHKCGISQQCIANDVVCSAELCCLLLHVCPIVINKEDNWLLDQTVSRQCKLDKPHPNWMFLRVTFPNTNKPWRNWSMNFRMFSLPVQQMSESPKPTHFSHPLLCKT